MLVGVTPSELLKSCCTEHSCAFAILRVALSKSSHNYHKRILAILALSALNLALDRSILGTQSYRQQSNLSRHNKI
jgi:hypothetical protein